MSIATPSRATKQVEICPTDGPGAQLHDFLTKPGRLLIDGEWVEAASGKTFRR